MGPVRRPGNRSGTMAACRLTKRSVAKPRKNSRHFGPSCHNPTASSPALLATTSSNFVPFWPWNLASIRHRCGASEIIWSPSRELRRLIRPRFPCSQTPAGTRPKAGLGRGIFPRFRSGGRSRRLFVSEGELVQYLGTTTAPQPARIRSRRRCILSALSEGGIHDLWNLR